MDKKKWVLAIILLVIAYGGYMALQTRDQLRVLEAEGFQADLRIDHTPLLLFDRNRREGALVYSDRYERFDVDQITALEWIETDKPARDPRPEMRIALRGVSVQEVRISERDSQLRLWYQQLTALRGSTQ